MYNQLIGYHVQATRAHEMEQPWAMHSSIVICKLLAMPWSVHALLVFMVALGLDMIFINKIRLSWFLDSRDWSVKSQITPDIRIGLYLFWLKKN